MFSNCRKWVLVVYSFFFKLSNTEERYNMLVIMYTANLSFVYNELNLFDSNFVCLILAQLWLWLAFYWFDFASHAVADPGFPKGGANSLGGSTNILLTNFSWKLHENKKILAQRAHSLTKLKTVQLYFYCMKLKILWYEQHLLVVLLIILKMDNFQSYG